MFSGRPETLAENRCAVDVIQAHRHRRAAAIDIHLSKELQTGKRRIIGRRRGFLKDHLRTEGVVQRVGAKAAGIERAGDEFPERVKISKLRLLGIVVMDRAIVHVGSEPNDVLDPLTFDVSQNVCDLEFAA
jgi:hypothetical protein